MRFKYLVLSLICLCCWVHSINAQTYTSQIVIIPSGTQTSTDNTNTYSNINVLGEKMVSAAMTTTNQSMRVGFVYFIETEPVEPTPLEMNNVTITDVTDTQFSVVWAVNQSATGNLTVFSDLNGTDDISELVTISCESCNQPDANSNGVMKMKVEGLTPDTHYYFKPISTAKIGGEILMADTIFQVTTEVESGVVNNNFIAQQIVKKGWTPENEADFIASGALLIVSVDGADYPVSAWVGDGYPGAYAGVDLSNVYDKSTHKALEIEAGTQMTLWAFGGLLGYNSTSWAYDNSLPTQVPTINDEPIVSILSEGVDISFKQGLNLFAYPVAVPDNFTSYDLFEKLGGCDEVLKIQQYAGTWDTTSCFFNDISGDSFSIENEKGLLIYMKNAKEFVRFEGSPINSSINLNVGFNLVGIPTPPATLTSGDLMEQLGAPDDINKIQRYSDQWETTTWFMGEPSGKTFPIENGKSYIIYMNQPKLDFRPTN